MSQQNNKKRHGDDKSMIRARSDFLNKGYYQPLCDIVIKKLEELAFDNYVIIDMGCGEAWYTKQIEQKLSSFKNTQIFGIDISKSAIEHSAKACKNVNFAVASAFKIPMGKNTCDCLISIFAPYDLSECTRILKANGIFIKVIPLEKHLLSLKKAVYDKPYENTLDSVDIKGFKLIDSQQLKYNIKLDNNDDIKNLFMMTPYYYKTGENDQKKLDSLEFLSTEVEFELRVYQKLIV